MRCDSLPCKSCVLLCSIVFHQMFHIVAQPLVAKVVPRARRLRKSSCLGPQVAAAAERRCGG